MATRSTIAIENPDGTVTQVYCHWDGYLENNGQILLDCYSDPANLTKLLEGGNMICLAMTPEKTEYYSPREEAQVHKNFNKYFDDSNFEEFNYILRKNGTWYVESLYTNNRFVPMTEDLFVV